MTDENATKIIVEIDPDNAPVQVINSIISTGYVGGLLGFTLRTATVRQKADGNGETVFRIAARVAFDLEMAKIIRDNLNQQIAVLSAPPGDVKAN